jgi:glycosyltransferase involved in cell wall biosynthesis
MFHNTPKVSIVLPSYNRAHLIDRAITSLLRQTYKDFEIIVIDDNSCDNTFEVVAKINDSRIKYFRNDVNLGPSGSRNKGMQAAKGEYIAFQDSDDEWALNKLEVMLSVFESAKKKPGMVFSSVYQILSDGKKTKYPTGNINMESASIYSSILFNNFVATPAAIITRDCFEKTGLFDTDLKCFEDYDFFIRVAKNYEVIHLAEPLVVQHQSIGGVNTPQYLIRAEMLKIIIEKHYEEYLKYPVALSERYFRLGDFYCLSGNGKTGLEYMIRAFKISKFNVQYIIGIFIALISLSPDIYGFIRKNIDGVRNQIKCVR